MINYHRNCLTTPLNDTLKISEIRISPTLSIRDPHENAKDSAGLDMALRRTRRYRC